MAKYIDSDKLCKGLKEMASVQCPDKQNTILGVVSTIKNTPTADVVEVKRGEWMPYYEEVEVYNSGGFTEKKRTGWICGKCKRKRSFTPYGTEKYCCECGAKMDLKEGVK